jgi:hypothetical protein
MKQTFYGVNEIHTLQVPNDDTNLYVGMNVQSDKRKTSEEVVMIFSEEQVLEMYEYLVNRVMEKNTILGQNYQQYKNKKK